MATADPEGQYPGTRRPRERTDRRSRGETGYYLQLLHRIGTSTPLCLPSPQARHGNGQTRRSQDMAHAIHRRSSRQPFSDLLFSGPDREHSSFCLKPSLFSAFSLFPFFLLSIYFYYSYSNINNNNPPPYGEAGRVSPYRAATLKIIKSKAGRTIVKLSTLPEKDWQSKPSPSVTE